MITISKAYWFDSSHQLWDDDKSPEWNVETFGKCARMHGHTYRLEVEVSGDVDPVTGMILNYFLLDMIVKPIVERIDHEFLNDKFVGLTTAENMVKQIADVTRRDLSERYDNIFLRKVTLQETPKTKAVWHNV